MNLITDRALHGVPLWPGELHEMGHFGPFGR